MGWEGVAVRSEDKVYIKFFSRFSRRFTVFKPKDDDEYDKKNSQWDEASWIANGAMDFLLPVYFIYLSLISCHLQWAVENYEDHQWHLLIETMISDVSRSESAFWDRFKLKLIESSCECGTRGDESFERVNNFLMAHKCLNMTKNRHTWSLSPSTSLSLARNTLFTKISFSQFIEVGKSQKITLADERKIAFILAAVFALQVSTCVDYLICRKI